MHWSFMQHMLYWHSYLNDVEVVDGTDKDDSSLSNDLLICRYSIISRRYYLL